MSDIQEWLVSGMDYKEGILIFEKHCKNKIFVRSLKNGNAKILGKKLEYEMKKLLGIPLTQILQQRCSNQQLINQIKGTGYKVKESESGKLPSFGGAGGGSAIPALILQAKELRNELFTQIADLHKDLYELGEENTEGIVKKRKVLLDRRKPLIERHEKVYQAIEEYFISKIIPASLNLLLTDFVLPENPKNDFEKQSDIQLIRIKNKIATKLSRLKNLLHFQTYTAQAAANPMPEGSKKKEIELSFKELRNDYNKIIQIIKSRE